MPKSFTMLAILALVANPYVSSRAASEKILYSFQGELDGNSPQAPLVSVNSTLYGTTAWGGGITTCVNVGVAPFGCGTVFSLTANGEEKVLHAFGKGYEDGYWPYAGLSWLHGKLYGTTWGGGGPGCSDQECGIVFTLNPNGKETIIHAFSETDYSGNAPWANLIKIKDTFYGTTATGGVGAGEGTVFSMSPMGTVTTLYSFQGDRDGAQPRAALTKLDGVFYGTTWKGGAGYGTVFALSSTGNPLILYRFTGGADGANPQAELISAGGLLYGTTPSGGTFGYGTVFSINRRGAFRTLHNFQGSPARDGAGSLSGLVNVNGTFYGATLSGGKCSASKYGCGTVFSITPAGVESVLHVFKGVDGSDGEGPAARLLAVDGKLYGTTSGGGSANRGTVFEVTP